jgi:hypothetical protein
MPSLVKVIILIGPTLIILAACRDGLPAVQTEPDCLLIGPTVSPASATLHPGDTLRVRSSDTLIAVVDSLTGLVRARSLGQASIIATALSDRALVGAMALQVKQ